MLLRAILRLIRQAGAPREQDTERDGFLSYAAETHAFVHGWFAGMFHKSPHPPDPLPDDPDIQAEPHYYKGGYIFGTLIQWTAAGVGAALGAIELGLITP